MMNLKMIAKKAGVSTATVSNVVNGNYHKVSEKTRIKVQKIIEENDYKPNAMAKGLASKESKIIGLVIPNVGDNGNFAENTYDVEMVALLENYIRKQGYYLMLRCVDRYRESIPLFSSWNVDGMIFFGTFKSEVEDIKKDLHVPAVFFDTYPEELKIANVGIDDYQAGFLSARYLLGKGHRNIAFVGPSHVIPGVIQERFHGFLDACSQQGVEILKENIFEVDTSFANGVTVGQRIATSGKNITAVSVMTDAVALGVIEGLRLCGVSVPDDISIIGFDNLPEGNVSSPKLTTISQHPEQKVKEAGDILFQMIREDKQIVIDKKINVEIIERQSVKELSLE